MRLYRLSFVGGQEKISPTSTRENDGKKTAFSHDKKSRQMNWTAICWSCSFDDIVMLGKLHRSRFFLARFVCRPLFDGSPPTSIFIQFFFFFLSLPFFMEILSCFVASHSVCIVASSTTSSFLLLILSSHSLSLFFAAPSAKCSHRMAKWLRNNNHSTEPEKKNTRDVYFNCNCMHALTLSNHVAFFHLFFFVPLELLWPIRTVMASRRCTCNRVYALMSSHICFFFVLADVASLFAVDWRRNVARLFVEFFFFSLHTRLEMRQHGRSMVRRYLPQKWRAQFFRSLAISFFVRFVCFFMLFRRHLGHRMQHRCP